MAAQRWKIVIEYDGAPFAGWQRQEPGTPTVQGALEAALTAFCQRAIPVHGAGRTDAGVHAAGQVAHFDLDYGARPLDGATLARALNAHLRPAPVAVTRVEPVSRDFHARFSASSKTYRYRILARPAPPALEAGRVWHLRGALDLGAMRAGAAYLVGHHDFTSFRCVHCQARNPVRTLGALEIDTEGQEVVLTARGRSFLHHQVRIIAGTLAKVGQGGWTPGDVAAALAARDRVRAGPTAPPQGLLLERIEYNPVFSDD